MSSAELVDQVELGSLPDGTAIGTALTLGLSQLKDLPPKASAVILVTDGANNTGEPQPARRRRGGPGARHQGVRHRVECGGYHGEQGRAMSGGMGRQADQLLASDEAILDRLTRRTGGRYFRATDPEVLRVDHGPDRSAGAHRCPDRRTTTTTGSSIRFFLVPGLMLLALQSLLAATWLRSLP